MFHLNIFLQYITQNFVLIASLDQSPISEIFILKIEILLVSKQDEYRNYWVLINAFQFALDLSNIDLLNIDLLDQRYTHLDLLDTDTPGKHFVCLQDVFKMSSSHVFKTSSRYVFKMSLRHVFKTSSRHVFKTF